ncbi:MAG: PIN domain-containing protein [Patescibacteria group bacterium]|nr:PIN domain-containing protein [Patescibacteria group bacterium]
MSKKYIFIDTNIYIYCALLTKDSKHNDELVKKLSSILDKDKNVVLIVPEIVKLEYERVSENEFKGKKARIKKIKDDIKSAINNGLSAYEKKKVSKLLQEIIKNTEENHKKVNGSLREMFKKKTTQIIKITPEIFVNAYKRAIAGRKPFSAKYTDDKKENIYNPINADCCIFEMILHFFVTQTIDEEDKLLFCTNDGHFFVKNKNSAPELAPELIQDLPIQISFYDNLPGLIKKEFGEKISKKTIGQYEDAVKVVEYETAMRNVYLANQINMVSPRIDPYNLGICSLPTNNVDAYPAFLTDQDTVANATIYATSPASVGIIRRCKICGSILESKNSGLVIKDLCTRCEGTISCSNSYFGDLLKR